MLSPQDVSTAVTVASNPTTAFLQPVVSATGSMAGVNPAVAAAAAASGFLHSIPVVSAATLRSLGVEVGKSFFPLLLFVFSCLYLPV